MRRVRSAAALLFAHAAIATANGALAQPARLDDDSVAAEALFTAGRADVEHGDYASACPKFAESQRLDPAAGTLINLADCEEHVGHLARAWQLWREAAERLSAADPRTPVVAERVEAIDRRVPRLTIQLGPAATSAGGARVVRDGAELSSRLVGVPLPVDPGDHVLVLTAEGFAPTRLVVQVLEGARQVALVDLGRPAAPAARPVDGPRAVQRAAPAGRWIGYGLLGLGAVGIAVGSVAGAGALDKKAEQNDHCFPAAICSPVGAAAAEDGRTLALVSTAAFAASAALLAAGLYVLLRASSTSGAP